MRCPTLAELPPPPPGKEGWPWTEECPQLPDTLPDGRPWPKISIVTASFNRAEYIEETIRGVLLQGYPNLEYIIVDGKSTDGTVEIIHCYRDKLSGFICEEDNGEYEAVNKGLKIASGDIVTFNSSDDVYLPGTFQLIGSLFPSYPHYGAFIGGFVYLDNTSRVTSDPIPPKLPHEGPIDLSVTSCWRLHQQATFYTAHALNQVGQYVREDLRYTGDRELLYRVSKRFKIKLIPETLAAFRVHSESLTTSSRGRYLAWLEYADLQKSFAQTGDGLDRKRLQIHRRFVAKAFFNRGKFSENLLEKSCFLLLAGITHPAYILRRGYVKEWVRLLFPFTRK